jgi:hypothetical protein
MESVAFQNKRSGDPVMHLLLSWKENETPTPEQAREAVKLTLDEMNMPQCQAVFSLHQNTDNLHLHICVNRIDPDTFKAIDPAHGFTHKGMERAARRIEYAQGWQIEDNAWTEIAPTGELVLKPRFRDAKIPQKTQDIENWTGEQSAIRKAQEVLKDAIKNMHSWDELHSFMLTNGMEYRKKGSGAVIHVGEIIVKASSVSKNLSLNKLEKSFGAYRELPDSHSINQRSATKISEPKPLGKSNDNPDWRTYITARGNFYRNKKQYRRELSMTQEKEKKELKDRQRGERSALSESFKGHSYTRQHINQQKSLLASKHAYGSVILKASHKAQRGGLQKELPAYRSYEEWLRTKGMDDVADGWRHRRDGNFLQLESPNPGELESWTANPKGLPGFSMMVTKQGLRFYREESPKEASFIDAGRIIRVYAQDDDTILASLQLAQEKWGGVHLNGTDEYKRRCAKLAAQHGIRIDNPELQTLPKTPEIQNAIRPREGESKHSNEQLLVMGKELARSKLRESAIIALNATNGRDCRGTLLGVVGEEGHYMAVQKISKNQVILHRVDEDYLQSAKDLVGRSMIMRSERHHLSAIEDAGIANERERENESDRDWNQ